MKALARIFAIVLAGLGYVRTAHAAEPEAVRFELASPQGCVDDAALRAEIGALGASFRDANLDDRARTFRVEVTEDAGRVKGRLLVRDLVFRETAREIDAPSCAEATRSLGLVVATALDEAPAPLALTPAPVSAPLPAVWPAPAESESSLRARMPRIGSGGVVLDGIAGGGPTGSVAYGVQGYAAARVGGSTRVGVAGSFTSEKRYVESSSSSRSGTGISSRVGALVGWGAPWSDAVVGFSLELGVALTNLHGTSRPGVPCVNTIIVVGDDTCYDDARAGQRQWSTLAPYAAWHLTLQLPIKTAPIRPVVAFGNLMETGPVGTYLFTAETGVVWQAW